MHADSLGHTTPAKKSVLLDVSPPQFLGMGGQSNAEIQNVFVKITDLDIVVCKLSIACVTTNSIRLINTEVPR